MPSDVSSAATTPTLDRLVAEVGQAARIDGVDATFDRVAAAIASRVASMIIEAP